MQRTSHGRLAVFLIIALTGIGLYASAGYLKRKFAAPPPLSPEAMEMAALRSKIPNLQQYARIRGMESNLFFLVDMSLSSGRNRFFVFDAAKDSVIMSGLVTHGRCNEGWLAGRKYSNVLGSGCTSLGRFKIGGYYQGRFGLAYKLYGLDESNSNAYKRSVVLHAHKAVPEKEVDPLQICQSDGCPTVSPGFLKKLDRLLKEQKRPILMYIFES
ncbi:murein L,D-transpeptidase catalytic domain-containing protein [Flavihumibacter petaseus]|uniref:Peptidase n=1 Tax=Flavihumibacter petaseus NBRC 106054 TaxID=1220578 RepID=A0A0E9MX83_9BACT|nr:murein L,D-transpeptidase catalytic domain family protein [Flavihumibacter petaseus]GAO41730.1 hypothetical protein FPE01S_01_07440 [Flavihumibacter petaseus NBRC 106054]